MDSKVIKKLEESYERIINVGLCLIPYEDLSDIVDPNVMIFGTTKDETILSFKNLDILIKSQYDQMGDVKVQLDRNRIYTKISDDRNYAIITESVKMTMLSPDSVNDINIRCSSVMEFIDNKWKLTHWHASTPVETENDHWHKEEWKRENEKLQKLVDEQLTDLKKKNRDLEVEAALERVRTVAMGMRNPKDMLGICRMISDQLQEFGVEHIRNVQTVIIDEETSKYSNYQYFTEYDIEKEEHVDYRKNPVVFELAQRMLESTDGFFTGTLSGNEFNEFRDYRKKDGQFPDPKLDEIESVDYHFFSIGSGGLGITLYRPLDEPNIEIFKRFHSVFSLAYQRFLDIQKAEAQAHEALIELSLERIRAQATAMQESSDLLDIVVTMRTEFVSLGHEAHYFWHMRWLPEKYEKAMTSGDGTRIGMVMTLPRHIHGNIKPVAEWEKSNEPIHVLAMDAETAVYYVEKMISLGDFERVDPQAPTLDDVRHIGGLTFVMARTTHGEIGFSLPGVVPNPSKSAVDTLMRFAAVFDLAYKRFEDLKVAERQHREAQIELALERVRARSMAMHKSDELAELSLELVKQVQALGVETWFCAFNIYDDDPRGSVEWGSNGQGTFPEYRTPREGVFLDYYEAGQRGDTLLINEIGENECPAHYEYLCSLPGVGDQLLKMKDAGVPFPTSQIDHVAFFKYGYVLFITFDPAPEAHEIFKRFAKVFEQTYTRFLDLQKAEAQALRAQEDLIAIKVARQRAEDALIELKATQSQLVQQEKLASLGQLTAGIAHEIKNPLNFVNNFSDVSLEMIDEALVELGKSTQDDHTAETAAILVDIKINLTKIHEHGTRADSIVKSMLMHSRGGSGKMEPTDLNALVKEYVNLAFHGMRAGKHPIDVDIEMNFDDYAGKVPLIAEEFSRVIMNLCFNAFDAMREQIVNNASSSVAYRPKLTVRTSRDKNSVTIYIQDNGPGIPDDIKDKILQPFFTTKKGTQGTGLGLSITHDIIKAHGGTLDVHSKPGQTVFTIKFER